MLSAKKERGWFADVTGRIDGHGKILCATTKPIARVLLKTNAIDAPLTKIFGVLVYGVVHKKKDVFGVVGSFYSNYSVNSRVIFNLPRRIHIFRCVYASL